MWCVFMRSYPKNPLQQRIKGVLIFKNGISDVTEAAKDLLKSLQCDILTSRDNRITITTSRGNMQHIKKCWESQDSNSDLSTRLNQHIAQIIIGGNI